MFELLMLVGFLYAGLIHLRPVEKTSEEEKQPIRGSRPHTRRSALRTRPARAQGNRRVLGKPVGLC